MLKQCIVCGNKFETKSGAAKFCSEKCRNAKMPVDMHIGEIHGELEIISVYRKNSFLYANCRCSCGKERTVKYCNLPSGHTRSCGHINNIEYSAGKINDYGIEILHKLGKKGKRNMLHCKCFCGKEFDVYADTFETRKSCGCIRNYSYLEQTDIYNILDRKMPKNNKSGVLGVYWDEIAQKWTAKIKFQRQDYYLGRYSKIEDAEKARKQAEKYLFENFLEWYADKYPEQWNTLIKNKKCPAQNSLEHTKIG